MKADQLLENLCLVVHGDNEPEEKAVVVVLYRRMFHMTDLLASDVRALFPACHLRVLLFQGLKYHADRISFQQSLWHLIRRSTLRNISLTCKPPYCRCCAQSIYCDDDDDSAFGCACCIASRK